MTEHTVTNRLKRGLYAALIAASLSLGLAGCGSSGTTPQPPNPSPQPRLSQTVSLSNPNPKDTCINYTATLTEVSQATRKIFHNDNLTDTLTITIPTYAETRCGSEKAKKGNYSFVLEAPNVNPHTATIDVPNYLPDRDQTYLDSLDFTLDEIYGGSQKTFDLKGVFTDKNPEDNSDLDNDGVIDGVPVTNATSLDGKTQVSVNNGYELTIKAIGVPGTYQVNVEYGSAAGGLENVVLTGNILAVPDQIAFWSNRGGIEEIYVMKIDGSGLVKLTTDPGQDLEPDWSPDGSKIAFTTNREDVNGDGIKDISIYIMNADGSNQRRLAPNIQHAQQADWSPDGSKIAFRYIDSDFGLAGIAVMNADDGSGFTRLVEEPVSGRIPGGPSWSPDGTKIAFYTHRDGNWEIYKMNADGSGLERLTNNLFVDQQPAWSPDGTRITFISDRDGGRLDIYLMNPDGSNVTQLTNEGSDVDPDWSPDSAKIVFTRNFQVWLMNNDGTGLIQLTSGGLEGENRYPAWRPR